MSFISLNEALDATLLAYYLEEVVRLSCQVFDAQGQPVFSSSAQAPVVPPEKLAELKAGPLPIDVSSGRAAGLFARGEYLGHVVVACGTEDDVPAADFTFQLVNAAIVHHLERGELSFDAEYFKNLITLMQRLSQKTSAVFDRKTVAEIFIGECEKIFGASSGAIFVVADKALSQIASFGRAFERNRASEHVLATRKIFVANTPATDELYQNQPGDLPINVLCVPLFSGKDLIGVLSLRDKQIGPFSSEDQRMAQTLATVLGSTIGNIQLYQNLMATERVKATLSRYLSPNLLKEVIETGRFERLGGSRMRAAILFADIRGFTRASERIAPELIVRQLNEYFEEMSKVIFAYDGTLDKYVGDLIMVLFGVPKPMPDAALRAVKTAIEMQQRIGAMASRLGAESVLAGGVGIGINIGDVVFGNIGSSQAMGLTVIGDNVNQAQRLEAYAGGGEIMITESVYDDIKASGIKTSKIGLVEVKGKQIDAYKVDY